MIVRTTLEQRGPITKEELQALHQAEKMPVVFDDDSPMLTEDDLRRFKKISEENKESRNKQTISLRLSPGALETARSLGKGYTSVLSRILENALKDKKTIEKYL